MLESINKAHNKEEGDRAANYAQSYQILIEVSSVWSDHPFTVPYPLVEAHSCLGIVLIRAKITSPPILFHSKGQDTCQKDETCKSCFQNEINTVYFVVLLIREQHGLLIKGTLFRQSRSSSENLGDFLLE